MLTGIIRDMLDAQHRHVVITQRAVERPALYTAAAMAATRLRRLRVVLVPVLLLVREQ
jgi:hypothetical protein